MSEVVHWAVYGAGVLVWIAFACAAIWLIAHVATAAFTSARFVARVYRHGMLIRTSTGKKSWIVVPAQIWWHGFWNGGFEYMTRVDGKGGRIYWPGKEPLSKHQEKDQ